MIQVLFLLLSYAGALYFLVWWLTIFVKYKWQTLTVKKKKKKKKKKNKKDDDDDYYYEDDESSD